MIAGDKDSGNELVAIAIHEVSISKDQPFVKVNCVSIPENLIKSELFGHEKDSFTNMFE